MPSLSFEWFSDPQAWGALLTLSLLEIVLGIDNIVFLSILVDRLPEHQRKTGRLLGLGLAMFARLVALRMAEEGLDEQAAVMAAIGENLFGLELDQRCTQIGAFNLALAAWRRVGHCVLPAMNLACSGLAQNTSEATWVALGGTDLAAQNGMRQLYRLFKNAPVLGSLINPRAVRDELLDAAFHELQPLLERAVAQDSKDDIMHEMAVTARGLAKAAEPSFITNSTGEDGSTSSASSVRLTLR